MEGDSTNDAYRECLRNHAASLGSYATDGCGEFTADETTTGGLMCEACGCHRNFHRKVIVLGGGGGRGGSNSNNNRARDAEVVEMMDYASTQPAMMVESQEDRSGKKRMRTKFTAEQKEKMLAFAEKLGWRIQRRDQEDEIEKFCKAVGVSRQVFKVWMHNHKNSSSSSSASTGNASSLTQ
ncbi:PREDICTED: zinc-finger homeodomain protein 1-like [Nelumbo nucifera]|uniref:ZF-HD dimerization-type domain-containing protein n=2 Tax=Nelumbo nucifera TaxID=4432 RepID=A0A822YT90_NELNU|nr:PREDICTED: zinc-finger homeodomain protein 1-like [Nelumbo nucifera]DAD35862.1 TPA_asm: hypothetical protein HUJ06_006502 [Nelumbo nucifera]